MLGVLLISIVNQAINDTRQEAKEELEDPAVSLVFTARNFHCKRHLFRIGLQIGGLLAGLKAGFGDDDADDNPYRYILIFDSIECY